MIQFDEHILQMAWFNHQVVSSDQALAGYSTAALLIQTLEVTIHLWVRVAYLKTSQKVTKNCLADLFQDLIS